MVPGFGPGRKGEQENMPVPKTLHEKVSPLSQNTLISAERNPSGIDNKQELWGRTKE